MAKTVLIIGANRGLGLEFARQYAADGCHVIATCRRPSEAAELRRAGVTVESLDTSTSSSIEALARKLGDESIDVMICNAGVYGPRTERLSDMPTEDFDLVMRTNVLGPLRLTLAFAENVARARGAMVFLSSRMGSIGTMSSPSGIAYRASKAALNAVVKATSLELGKKGVRVMALHPGWVRTDMGGPQASLTPTESVAGMRHVIEHASDKHGGFFDNTGATIPW
ncbi:MAG: SDR family oxidoreductase [Proteobacteria bacterium]|nr:SDR family oxidoreductase [Pseudomonadota bacterium]